MAVNDNSSPGNFRARTASASAVRISAPPTQPKTVMIIRNGGVSKTSRYPATNPLEKAPQRLSMPLEYGKVPP